jgi:CHASE2 domain-containing sensor protein
VHGQAIDAVARASARVIGFDVIFDQPSARGPADDQALGAAITRAGNVVLATAFFVDEQPTYTRRGYLLPLPPIRHGAAAVASVTVWGDEVGRRISVRDMSLPAAAPRPGSPTFPVQVARLSAGADTFEPRLGKQDFLINFRGGPGTFRRISYHRLVRDPVAARELRGATVLVGIVDPTVPDFVRTPFARGGTMPGVEVLANAIETLLRGDAIHEVPVAVSVIVTVMAGLLAGAFVAWWPGRAVEGTAGVLTLLVGATYAAFAYGDVWFRATGPCLALVVGLVLAIVARGTPRTASA